MSQVLADGANAPEPAAARSSEFAERIAAHRAALARFVSSAPRTVAVDDIVQETLLRALEIGAPLEGDLLPWLRAIARRVLLEARHERARSRLAGRDASERLDALVADEISPPPLAGPDTRRIVVEALRRLPERYRAILLERYLHDRSVARIAESMGLPASAIDSLLRRALRRLRERVAAKLR